MCLWALMGMGLLLVGVGEWRGRWGLGEVVEERFGWMGWMK